MDAADMLFDQVARVGVLIWIPGAVADVEDLPEVFEDDFCQMIPERKDHILFAQLPALARFVGTYPEPAEVAEVLRHHGGFLIRAETPVKTFLKSGGFSHSWGYFRLSWLYAASEGEIADVVIAWAKSVDEDVRAIEETVES